jgi:hypothetical protein
MQGKQALGKFSWGHSSAPDGTTRMNRPLAGVAAKFPFIKDVIHGQANGVLVWARFY